MRRASVGYTAAFLAGTVVSLRRSYSARPLGMKTGFSPLVDVLIGNGAALAAPWPLIVLLWRAEIVGRHSGRKGRRGRAYFAALSALFLAGAVAEPVSHRVIARDLPSADAVIAVLNVALPTVMLGSALSSLVDFVPMSVEAKK